jgi:hypothetical protein
MKNYPAPWLKDLGLSADEFRRCPEGEDPLLWGLRNQLVPEAAYQIWASETYGLPRLDSAFFDQAFDSKLLSEYADLYNWSPHCYPIYEWENVVYVASLKPESIPLGQKKVCCVIASYSALVQTWTEMKVAPAEDIFPAPPAPPEALSLEPLTASRPALRDTQVGTKTKVPPPPPEVASLGDLDFSSMDSLSQPAKTPVAVPMAEATQTKIDSSPMNNLTSATQTIQERKAAETEVPSADLPFPQFDFDNLSHGNLSLEGDAKKEAASAKKVAKPSVMPPPPAAPQAKSPGKGQPEVTQSPLDFDFNFDLPPAPAAKVTSEKAKAPAPTLTEEMPLHQAPQEATPTPTPNPTAEEMDDDYTPVPFISEEERARFKHTSVQMGRIPKPEGPIENTVTDTHRAQNHAPIENLITDTDLTRCVDLKNCRSGKDVMSHVFLHLRKDYKKLMWVELAEDNHFYPKYVYGNWSMTPDSWGKSVDLLKPNIFRIASQSNLPFHGEVSDNPINTAYFAAWTGGKKPDVVTIYPVSEDDVLKGFVVAFSINEEFDEVASLTKIGNLMSICAGHLFQAQQKKSA